LIFLACVLAAFLKTPIYQSEGKLQIQNQSSISQLSGLSQEVNKPAGLSQLSNPTTTELETLQSISVLKDTIKQLNLRNAKGQLFSPEMLQEQLLVSEVKGADVLKVQYRSPNPQTATAVVNTLMEVYLRSEQNSNRNDIRTAQRFLDRELPRAEQDAQQAETALRQFKEIHQIAELQEKNKFAETQLNTLTSQIADARAQLADVTAQIQDVSDKLGLTSEQAIAATTLSQSSEIQNLVNQIQQIETKLIQERERLTEEHPQVLALETNLNDLRASYQARSQKIVSSSPVDSSSILSLQRQNLSSDLVKLEASRKGLTQKIANLSNSSSSYREQVSTLPRLEQQYRDLERRLQLTQSTLAKLLQQNQEVQLLTQQSNVYARVISPATSPTNPIAPRKSLYLITGLVLGVLFGYGAAYLTEMLTQSVRTSVEARQIFSNWPILGFIPIFAKPRNSSIYKGEPLLIPGVVVRDQPNTSISESFRRLQVTIEAIKTERSVKSIVFTSSVEQEGKSTLCANLGAALAQAGQRVLLVDANLHHPCQHELWELPNEIGLTHLLTGQADSRRVTQRGMNFLDIITAGKPSTHPTVRLQNRAMQRLIQELSSRYDWVILDTPAINRSADALVWGNVVDGLILTVCPLILDFVNAIATRETLEISQQSLLGLVINSAGKERKDYASLTQHEQVSTKYSPTSVQQKLPKESRSYLSAISKTDNTAKENIQSVMVNNLQKSSLSWMATDETSHLSLFDMPIQTLQDVVEELQQEWENFAQVTLDLEERHQLQEKLLNHLEAQMNLARQLQIVSNRKNKELVRLENRWSVEHEQKKLLDNALLEHKKELDRKQTQWEEAVSILTTRQPI
jgi:capsular exopolysaccharide synthesis family protein